MRQACLPYTGAELPAQNFRCSCSGKILELNAPAPAQRCSEDPCDSLVGCERLVCIVGWIQLNLSQIKCALLEECPK